jgi:hypothetical protein
VLVGILLFCWWQSNMGTDIVNDRLLLIWLVVLWTCNELMLSYFRRCFPPDAWGKRGSSGEGRYLSRINGAHTCYLFLAPVTLLKLLGCGHWRLYTENSELWPVGTWFLAIAKLLLCALFYGTWSEFDKLSVLNRIQYLCSSHMKCLRYLNMGLLSFQALWGVAFQVQMLMALGFMWEWIGNC